MNRHIIYLHKHSSVSALSQSAKAAEGSWQPLLSLVSVLSAELHSINLLEAAAFTRAHTLPMQHVAQDMQNNTKNKLKKINRYV